MVNNICAVIGCRKTFYPGCGIPFHRLPSKIKTRKKWIEVIPGKLNNSSAICSLHFKPCDYLTQALKKLKPEAIPSIFPEVPIMVLTCCVKACNSECYLGSGISFHKFPNDTVRFAKWVSIVSKERGDEFYTPCKNSKICSIHFDKLDITGNKQRHRLLKSAIPKLQIHYPTKVQSAISSKLIDDLTNQKLFKPSNAVVSDILSPSVSAPFVPDLPASPNVFVDSNYVTLSSTSSAAVLGGDQGSSLKIHDVPGPSKPVVLESSSEARRPSNKDTPDDTTEFCRICLAADCTLYSMAGHGNLGRLYETLTGLSPREPVAPSLVCASCARRLLECARFRARCLKAHVALLRATPPVTLGAVKAVIEEEKNDSDEMYTIEDLESEQVEKDGTKDEIYDSVEIKEEPDTYCTDYVVLEDNETEMEEEDENVEEREEEVRRKTARSARVWHKTVDEYGSRRYVSELMIDRSNEESNDESANEEINFNEDSDETKSIYGNEPSDSAPAPSEHLLDDDIKIEDDGFEDDGR